MMFPAGNWSKHDDRKQKPSDSTFNARNRFRETDPPIHQNLDKKKPGAEEISNNNKHLHPSWQASKSKKNKILPFTGTHIRFDDDQESNAAKTFSKKQSCFISTTSKSRNNNSSKSKNDKLHPSWRASKKQKDFGKGSCQKSKAFTIKTNHTSVTEVETLHPSWEASRRKKEQNKIVEFTGTRITFD